MFCPACGSKNEENASNCIQCNASLAVKVLDVVQQDKAKADDPYSTNLSVPSGNLASSNTLPPSAYETTEIPAAQAQELLDKEAKKQEAQREKKKQAVSKANKDIASKEKTVKPKESTNWQLNLSVQWTLLAVTLAIASLFFLLVPKIYLSVIHYPESLIRHHLFLQITGFIAVALVLLQVLLSLRKRWNFPNQITFNSLRAVHIICGTFLTLIVFIHTGGYWKWNINGCLLIVFLLTTCQATLGNALEVRLTRRMILRRLAKKYKGNTGPVEEERVTKAVLAYLEKSSQNEEISQRQAKQQAKDLWVGFIRRFTDLQLMWAERKLKKEIAKKRNSPEEGALTTQLSKLAASRFWAEISRNKRPTPVQLMKTLWLGLHIVFVSSFLVLLFFHILAVYYF